MGLSSKGSIATLWDIQPEENFTKARISISKKNTETGEWIQDFGAYVRFVGRAHNVVKKMAERDKVKITDFTVFTPYNKDTKTSYTNYVIWDCDKFEYPPREENEEDNPF